MKTGSPIFTIGHSTHPITRFLELLLLNKVSAVADVRSSPYSKFAPQYNREVLKTSLKDAGINYVFLGKELGARSEDQSCYVNGVVSYERLSRTDFFRSGIRRIEDGHAQYRVGLMCSERDPTECHRTILVSRVLSERGVEVRHILSNGDIETHEETMLRVLDILGMPREDMFDSREELIAKAYLGRERQIAYRKEDVA